MQTCKNCGEAIYYSLHNNIWQHFASGFHHCVDAQHAEPIAGEEPAGSYWDWAGLQMAMGRRECKISTETH